MRCRRKRAARASRTAAQRERSAGLPWVASSGGAGPRPPPPPPPAPRGRGPRRRPPAARARHGATWPRASAPERRWRAALADWHPARVSLRRRARLCLATSTTFDRAVHAIPPLEARAWRSARRYVAGPAAQDAFEVAGRLAAVGLGTSLDLFGERTSAEWAPAVAAEYERVCAALPDATPPSAWLSLDLSHIAFDGALLDRIAAAVPPGRRLQIGAEEAAHAD